MDDVHGRECYAGSDSVQEGPRWHQKADQPWGEGAHCHQVLGDGGGGYDDDVGGERGCERRDCARPALGDSREHGCEGGQSVTVVCETYGTRAQLLSLAHDLIRVGCALALHVERSLLAYAPDLGHRCPRSCASTLSH